MNNHISTKSFTINASYANVNKQQQQQQQQNTKPFKGGLSGDFLFSTSSSEEGFTIGIADLACEGMNICPPSDFCIQSGLLVEIFLVMKFCEEKEREGKKATLQSDVHPQIYDKI
jgi:hypothetical protein